MAVTGTGGAHGTRNGTRNWRRFFFYAVEVTFAVIAGTGESFMYAAYLPAGPERWPEAIARATITQIIIILFGVAAIEAWRMRSAAGRIFFTLAIWGVTMGAGLVTFWFLWEAAQVFRDTAMLAPLEHARIALPNGAVIPNWMIDVSLIAALPFFQTVLNILAPIITADHAAETLEQQHDRQQRELAQARFAAEKAALKAQGWGAAIGGGLRAARASVSGERTPGHDDTEPHGSDAANLRVSSPDTAGYGDAPEQTTSGAKAPLPFGKSQWTSRQLKNYAEETYGVVVSDIDAQNTMKVLSEGAKKGNAYVAPRAKVRAWVERRYSAGNGSTEPTSITR